MIQLIIPNVCTKFQNPGSSSSREIFDEKKVYTHTNTLTNGNIAKSEQSSHTPGGSHQRPYHINWKEKWTNKRTDKQYVAEFFIHSTTCHNLICVTNFKILGQVVPEKSLTKNIGVRDRTRGPLVL